MMRAAPPQIPAILEPQIPAILERHGLPRARPEPGHNPTYPTFLCGETVVKLFAGFPGAALAFAAERAALAALERDPAIQAPRLLAAATWPQTGGANRTGNGDSGETRGLPYIVMSRVAGQRADRAALTGRQRLALAQALGEAVRRLHALPPVGLLRPADWRPVSFEAALDGFPSHLRAQAPAYAAGLDPAGLDPAASDSEGAQTVFVHLDLCAQHVFVTEGRLAGLIDWGDALAADPHLELIQLYRDTFACDARLFAAFLEAYGWRRDAGFARRALAGALHRQAIGRAQHRSIDVFQPIADRLPLADIPDLDALAARTFGLSARA